MCVPSFRTPRWALTIIAVAAIGAAVFSRQKSQPPESQVELLDGFRHEVFASQDLVSHPVALDVDDSGQVFVVETHCFEMQDYDDFDAQLACRTVEDAQRLFRATSSETTTPVPPECLRRLRDTNGDGTANQSEIVFQDMTRWSGCAAGVVSSGSHTWFGNAPNLWKLRDENGDGRAEYHERLLSGFGVRPKLLGHDLHGLTFGPDGRLYFSMGDRGLHVETVDATVSVPDCGSILRCWPDGSQLELYATGLRNPQGLAFDADGNLWTCDNDSNLGDRSRWLYVVEGGDYGWRIGFQLLPQCGPFQTEGISDPAVDVPWRVPPIGQLSKAPGGLAAYPGIGFPKEFDGCFMLADFAGEIIRIHVAERGAGFRIRQHATFATVNCPTDVKFGPDGSLFVSDWMWPYQMRGQGRVIRIGHPSSQQRDNVEQVKRLLVSALPNATPDELTTLLDHPSQRVRWSAQARLVASGESASRKIIKGWEQRSDRAKRQACWALGQLASTSEPARQKLLNLLDDDGKPELTVAALRGLSVHKLPIPADKLIHLMPHESHRVKYFALLAAQHQSDQNLLLDDAILSLAQHDAAADPFLRHACMLAVAARLEPTQLASLSTHESESVRLVAVLALRRTERPEIARFLSDASIKVFTEAVRAIHDVPIEAAYPALAKQTGRTDLPTFVIRRILSVNHRLGDNAALERVAAIADCDAEKLETRRLAIHTLAQWNAPLKKNFVTGAWAPLPVRHSITVIDIVEKRLPAWLQDPQLAEAAAQAVERLELVQPETVLIQRAMAPGIGLTQRSIAIRGLARQHSRRFLTLANRLLCDDKAEIREQTLELLPSVGEGQWNDVRRLILDQGEPVRVRQAALRLLSRDSSKAARKCVADLISNHRLPTTLALEEFEAATAHGLVLSHVDTNASHIPVEAMLRGGDAKRGAAIFHSHANAQCSRCHVSNSEVLSLGPSLKKIGTRQTRRQILDSILHPSTSIAEAYRQITVTLADGKQFSGRKLVTSDHEASSRSAFLILVDAQGVRREFTEEMIDFVSEARSSMPDDFAKRLSGRELRDLVEYLAHE